MANNVAVGVPVPDHSVPMGAAVSADDLVREARKQIAESAAAAEERVRREAHRAGDFEREALQRAGYAAQARMLSAIDAAVTATIDKKLPNALAAHIASSEGVRRISQDVEAQVERSARDVVKRIATYEVATRSMSTASQRPSASGSARGVTSVCQAASMWTTCWCVCEYGRGRCARACGALGAWCARTEALCWAMGMVTMYRCGVHA